jgi:hypothetical protein
MTEDIADWQKEDRDSLRAIEQQVRDEVDEMDDFAVSFEDEKSDDRDYVDHMFKDFTSNDGVIPKKLRGFKCVGSKVPKLDPGVLALLCNYKVKKTQGKRDALANNHVLRIPTLKIPHEVPIHLARKYALSILKLVDAAEDELTRLGISLTPSNDDEQ